MSLGCLPAKGASRNFSIERPIQLPGMMAMTSLSSQVHTLPKAKSKAHSKQNKDMHKCSSVYSERGVPLPVLTSLATAVALRWLAGASTRLTTAAT
jgi:hypothetical protein